MHQKRLAFWLCTDTLRSSLVALPDRMDGFQLRGRGTEGKIGEGQGGSGRQEQEGREAAAA